MSSEESSRKTAANKPAHREQETATHAQRKPQHSDGGKWPLPFDDDDTGGAGEIASTSDPKIDMGSDA
jgi:hypothetical protein